MSSNSEYELIVRQQPKQARMCSTDKVDRRPIDPPPVIQLVGVGSPSGSPNETQYLENPYYFMFASLATDAGEAVQYLKDGTTPVMTGAAVSNLWHLQDPQNDNLDVGFFVFPELSIRSEGKFRLKLTLFEVQGAYVHHCKSILSDPFCVYAPTRFPGMQISTDLSCSLADQGIKIRLRHDTRVGNKPTKRVAEHEAREVSRKRGRKSTRGDGGGRRSTDSKANGYLDDGSPRASTSTQPNGDWSAIDPSLTETANTSMTHAQPGYPEYPPPRSHVYSPPVPGVYEGPFPPMPPQGQPSAPYTYGHHAQPGGWHAPPHVQHAHHFPPPPPDWYTYQQQRQQAVAESDRQAGGGTKESGASHARLGTTKSSSDG